MDTNNNPLGVAKAGHGYLVSAMAGHFFKHLLAAQARAQNEADDEAIQISTED